MVVHTENYTGGTSPIHDLRLGSPRYPMTLHGFSLSLGSAEGQDPVHLDCVSQVADGIDPALVSEHVVWSISGSNYLADLLPLPMTEEILAVVCRNVRSHKKGRTNGRDSVGIQL
jgi:uncharacterized protein (UPF0276 family)